MERILIFTGKGGVGKTSVAAAHARKSAAEGKKTLLVSTDMAHNLSDIFEKKVGRECVKVADYLDALELDPEYIMQNDYADLMNAMYKLLNSKGMGDFEGDEILMLPGMEELFSLLKLLDIEESAIYERIIVDCAPTGETLSLLKFPELLGWYMEKFFPIGKVAVRVLAPISKHFYQIELPDKHAMTDIERLYVRLIKLQELLKDFHKTSVRLVTLPEKMVVEETKRNYMYLNLYGYQVDGIYINRVLPEDVKNDFFAEWFSIQGHYMEQIEQIFAGIPIFKIPWYEQDICGMDGVDRIVEDVLDKEGLFAVQNRQENERYEKIETGYQLRIFLPFVQKEEVDFYYSGTDLILRLGNFKRVIPLPDILRHYKIESARLEGTILYVKFTKKEGYYES